MYAYIFSFAFFLSSSWSHRSDTPPLADVWTGVKWCLLEDSGEPTDQN